MILALDIATALGAAWGKAGAQPRYTTVDLRHRAGTPGVILNLAEWLGPLCTEIEPQLVVFESPYMARGLKGGMPTNAHVARRLYGMVGYVETLCLKRGIRCLEASAPEITKFFLGKSAPMKRAPKKAATIARCEELGWPVEDDNQADALALWCMTEEKFCPGVRRATTGPLFNERRPAEATAERRKSSTPSNPVRSTTCFSIEI